LMDLKSLCAENAKILTFEMGLEEALRPEI
jgi:hypothetical protein